MGQTKLLLLQRFIPAAAVVHVPPPLIQAAFAAATGAFPIFSASSDTPMVQVLGAVAPVVKSPMLQARFKPLLPQLLHTSTATLLCMPITQSPSPIFSSGEKG